MSNYFFKLSASGILVFSLMVLTQCSGKSAALLPQDILGIQIGMTKDDAQKKLKEIAVFERGEVKNQEVWRLKDSERFVILTVGYDVDGRIRHVAGIANEKGSQKLSYAEVGDLSRSKQNVSPGSYEYVWDVPATQTSPAYQVISNGNKPDYLMILTIKKSGVEKSDEDEEEREEREEREKK